MRSEWNLSGFLWSYAIAGILALSFLSPPTRAIWDVLDAHIAFVLNSIVRDNSTQQIIWAFANLRVFDYVAAAAMLTVVVCYVVKGRNAARDVRIARMIATTVMLIALVAFTRQFLFHDISRDSPSLVLDNFTMLSQQTALNPKDQSGQSFPGDHATVLATFTFLLWYFAGWRYGLSAAALAVLFVLPRLISGAHWFSDVFVGGVGTALVAVPLVIFTPLEAYIIAGLLRTNQRCKRLIADSPILDRRKNPRN